MKKFRMTVVSIITAAACAACVMHPFAVNAETEETKEQEEKQEPQEKNTEKESGEIREETVYVFAKADGTTDKILVSDWAGDEKDEYSRYESKEELPVSMKVSYFLDDKELTADEMAGKSGTVTIRYEFENQLSREVTVNGKKKTVHVPFMALTAVILNHDVFSDIEVTGGKLLNDGDRTLVIGTAFPGLSDNFSMEEDLADLPESLEITAETENFEMLNTMTLVSSRIFSELDKDREISTDELTEKLQELTDAMSKLMDGAGQLKDGIGTLQTKSGELSSGVGQLSDGAGQLLAGAGALNSGAGSLCDGAGQLENGLAALSSNSGTLNDGAAQVFDSLIAQANSQLQELGVSITKENYREVLDGAVSANREKIEAMVTAGAREMVLQQVLAGGNPVLTKEDYDKLDAETKEKIDAAVDTQMQDSAVQAQIAAKIEEECGTISGMLETLKGQLDSYSQFYQGLLQYTAGVDSAKEGASALSAGAGQLKAGTETLSSGASALNDGILQLQGNIPALTDGVSQLYDGSSKLADGLQELNDKGISKLTDAVNGDLNGLVDDVKMTVEAAKTYSSLSKEKETDEGVKFIYRTESIR